MKNKSTYSAIHANCLECQGGSYDRVRCCDLTGCPLWVFRFGVRPSTIEKTDDGFLVDPDAPMWHHSASVTLEQLSEEIRIIRNAPNHKKCKR